MICGCRPTRCIATSRTFGQSESVRTGPNVHGGMTRAAARVRLVDRFGDLQWHLRATCWATAAVCSRLDAATARYEDGGVDDQALAARLRGATPPSGSCGRLVLYASWDGAAQRHQQYAHHASAATTACAAIRAARITRDRRQSVARQSRVPHASARDRVGAHRRGGVLRRGQRLRVAYRTRSFIRAWARACAC